MLAWHDALNASDLDTLAALSSDDIEVGDAHGAAQGHDALRSWAAALNASETTVEVGRMYFHDGVVVVEQTTNGPAGPAATAGASAFRVVHDHVTSVFRHQDVESALAATELNENDLVN